MAAQAEYPEMIYRPAVRANVGSLIMLAGPAGSGKTKSALRLARGLVGPDGVIALADTDNGRALYYADEFRFNHLPLSEPFRPEKFEAAAVAAQKQKAVVWICDNFSAEHIGPGGVLDYQEEELQRMAGQDYEKRERMKMVAWIKPKGAHKHMLQRFWQLNCHVILCCQAEKKIELQLQTEGKNRGKTVPVNLGYQPICGGDIPYAMTMSFMLDVARPGVPVVIKPLLDDLKPLIDLNGPITEDTGARIAAWARGEKRTGKAPAPTKPAPAQPQPSRDAPPPGEEQTATEPPPPEEPPPYEPPETTQAKTAPASTPRQTAAERRMIEGAHNLAALFKDTDSRKAHLAIVDREEVRTKLDWLKKHRSALYKSEVLPAMKESWDRTDPAKAELVR
jgi:DNA polymerase III delta prime subunit